jgi:putative copper export protein
VPAALVIGLGPTGLAAWRRLALLAPFLALFCALSLSGHAIAGSDVWLRAPADMVHAICATLWLGGLIQLWLLVRHPDAGERDVSATAMRYSRLAFVSVIALTATGLLAALEEIGLSWEALVATTYGQLVIVKVALLGGTMPVAAINRNRNVPGLSDRKQHAQARTVLGRYVRYEATMLVVVMSPGHFTTPAVTIPQPGRWTLVFTIRRGEWDEETASWTIDIRQGKTT